MSFGLANTNFSLTGTGHAKKGDLKKGSLEITTSAVCSQVLNKKKHSSPAAEGALAEAVVLMNLNKPSSQKNNVFWACKQEVPLMGTGRKTQRGTQNRVLGNDNVSGKFPGLGQEKT